MFFTILVVLFVILLLCMRFEATYLELCTINLTNNGNLKIMQLSDIHIKHLKVSTNRIRTSLLNNNPDIVILTGDYIDTPKYVKTFINFLKQIKVTNSAYLLCLGNHDYKAYANDARGLKNFINTIRSLGITVLLDDLYCFEKNNKKYNIVGLEDLRYRTKSVDLAFNNAIKNATYNIVFSHNPDIAFQLTKDNVDLLLCGHFHGGQIWAPFNLEFLLLRHERLCRMGMKRGLHKINGFNIYINRGIGNTLFPLRFLSRPEITVLNLP